MRTLAAAHIDDDADSRFLEGFETISAGLPSAVEVGGDLGEIQQADIVLAASHLALGGRGSALFGLLVRLRLSRQGRVSPERKREPEQQRRCCCGMKNPHWVNLIASCRSGCVISPQSFCRSP